MEDDLNSKLEELVTSNFIKLKESILNDISEQKLEKEKQYFKENKDLNLRIHKNVICSNCFKKNFTGKRYICCECDNYNLCEDCEELRCKKFIEHNLNHIFLKLNKPINVDINKYDNIIKGKNQNLTVKNNEAIANITIFNTGEESLKDCFLSQIIFGRKVLTGKKIKIEEDVYQNEKIDCSIVMDVNKETVKEGDTKEYISEWRMFTKEGLPFGEIISLYINDLTK